MPIPFESACNETFGMFEVRPHHPFSIGHSDPKDPLRFKTSSDFLHDSQAIFLGKMFQDMLAKYAIKTFIIKWQCPAEINKAMHITIGESVYIDPLRVIQPAGPGTKIKIYRSRPLPSEVSKRALFVQYTI